ncbi:MAG: aldo/keto reductase [Alphaproteobacteria bacterium]|nr:aldo/keto reductase [Alphaproteobacteria bacterium]
MTFSLTRRGLGALAGGLLLSGAAAARPEVTYIKRAIPHTNDRVPGVGLGTASVFNTNDEPTRAKADAVIAALLNSGCQLIDTAAAYGDAEAVIGDVIASKKLRNRVFIATKIRAPEREQLTSSLTRLRTDSVDLLQLHNVRDPQQSLERFREWKKEGLCRYIGITSTSHNDYPAVAAILERERPDFIQIDYSLDNREVEKTLLPLAGDIGAAVLTALPFGKGRLFRAVQGREVPEWARSFAPSWAQFFLKFLLADPRILAVIPGTSDAAHMADNTNAVHGPLPSHEMRQRMVEFIATL